MNKKITFIVIIWFAAGFSFVVEQFYLNGFLKKEKLENYTNKSGELLESMDKKLSGLITSGQFDYLLWSQGHITDELSIIKAAHPLIRDVLILSSEFHLLAGSTDHYSEDDLASMLEKTKNAGGSLKFVRKTGYFLVYPVENENKIAGYVVAVAGIPTLMNGGCAYIMDLSRSNLYCNKPDYLSASDTDILYAMLLKTAIGTRGKSTLKTATPKEIHWNFYQPQRIYFGYIVDKKPVYQFAYIYIGAVSFLLTLLVLFIGKKSKPDKYENFEKIIENNIKTLTEMKKGMELLLKEPPRERIIEIESAREISAEEESDEIVTGFYHRPETDGGETGISDFIFLDPLDTRWYKPLKKRYKLPQKYTDYGKDAFSEELLNLMREVSGEEEISKEAQHGSVENIPQEEIRIIQKDPLASSLERIYSTDDMGEELEIGIEYVRNYGKADGIAVLFFNEQAGCYMIEMSSGLDSAWNRHFYILSNDSILPVSSGSSTNIIISEKEIENPFFRKRIPPEFIGRLAAVKLLPVSPEHILVRIALFYFNDGQFFRDNHGKITSALSALDNAKFYGYFKETLPAFGKVYFEKQKSSINPGEPYKDIYNILKGFTITSSREALVVHAESEKVIDLKFREELTLKCKNILQGNERFIVNNPNHLIFLLNRTSPEVISKLLTEMGGKFDINTLRYPELGKNLFAYI